MKPMLATEHEADKVRYPVLASVKVDGVRAIIRGGVAYSRTLKPLPNEFIQAKVRKYQAYLEGFDGEITVGPENAKDVMQKTMAGVMRKTGSPDFLFLVFDLVDTSASYSTRNEVLSTRVDVARISGASFVQHLKQFPIADQAELDEFEAKALESGFEGVMIRDPQAAYKHGRSTVKEGGLLKVKRFVDGEAVVLGVQELMHNANTAEVNELGRTKRSTAKSGLVAADTLGALLVRDLVSGQEFSIGTGYTAEKRKELWDLYWDDSQRPGAPNKLVGKIVKYKSFVATGVKEAPRFPVFLGFRDAIDIGEAA